MVHSHPAPPFVYPLDPPNIVASREKEFEWIEGGTEKHVAVSPDEGYETFDDQLVFRVSADNFPNEVEFLPGIQFQSESPQGAPVVTVTNVENEVITVD